MEENDSFGSENALLQHTFKCIAFSFKVRQITTLEFALMHEILIKGKMQIILSL